MEFISNDQQIVRALTMYAYSGVDQSNLTMEQKAQLLDVATTGAPGDIICNTAEFLYAHYNLLDDAGEVLMAQLFAFAERKGWSGFNVDNRCAKIVTFVMREHGEQTIIPLDDEVPPKPQTILRADSVDWREEEGLIQSNVDMPAGPVTFAPANQEESVLELNEQVASVEGEPTP